MPYKVTFKNTAEKQFAALPDEAKKQVGTAIDSLTKNALPPGSKPLRKATGFRRLDAGAYRIVYSRARQQQIYIMRIQHRDTVYKNMRNLQDPGRN
ncbi:MAG: type II toxin-antitoxin system RelE/ParE family toxin [Xanthobacteraceae bacterium]